MNIENPNVTRWIESLQKAEAGKKGEKLASYLVHLSSKPKRQRVSVNLDKINRLTKDNDSVIVPGKVLGAGKISKKIKISAMDFSDSALKKLSGAKCDIVKIDEMVTNKSARIII